jgi:RRXRR protein
MSKVFVLDTQQRPLNPVHPGRARLLLTQGRAAIFRHYPFTIIMRQEVYDTPIEPLRLKIDPGSKTTGLAVVHDATGCATDRYGFPRRHRSRHKSYLGFRTGDLVRATVPSGTFVGRHTGCVTIRHRPSFRLNGHDVHPRYCTHLHKGDGYAYAR